MWMNRCKAWPVFASASNPREQEEDCVPLPVVMEQNVTYRIETRNHYLRVAVEVLFARIQLAQHTCIIDLSSYHSLQEILQCIRRNNDVDRFIFIGDHGMHSRILRSLISVDSHAPLLHYYETLRHCPGVSYNSATEVLQKHRSMSDYSHQDKTTVYSLLMRDSMQGAARLIGISCKLMYQRVDRLTKKLFLRSGLQAHQFFRQEFHPDYVRARIDDQLRASLRRERNTGMETDDLAIHHLKEPWGVSRSVPGRIQKMDI